MRALMPFAERIPPLSNTSGEADSLATHWSLAIEVPASVTVRTLNEASSVPAPVVEKTRYVLLAT